MLLKTLRDIAELKPEITYVVADKGGLLFKTEQKIIPLLLEAVGKKDSEIPKKIIADLDFIGKNSIFFALIRTEYHRPDSSKEIRIEATKIEKDACEILEKKGIRIVEIAHRSSRLNECLQIVDLVSGSIFQKFENNEDKYLLCLNDVTISSLIIKLGK